jgi:hypothetical protein
MNWMRAVTADRVQRPEAERAEAQQLAESKVLPTKADDEEDRHRPSPLEEGISGGDRRPSDASVSAEELARSCENSCAHPFPGTPLEAVRNDEEAEEEPDAEDDSEDPEDSEEAEGSDGTDGSDDS